MTAGSFATQKKTITKVRLLQLLQNWAIGMLFSLMVIFQNNSSQVLEKDIPGYFKWQEAL